MDISVETSIHELNIRAASETRTRDPQLGKLMLYQLSYYRIHKMVLHFGVQMYLLFFKIQITSRRFLAKFYISFTVCYKISTNCSNQIPNQLFV